LKIDLTNTASASLSSALDIAVGGSSIFSVSKVGVITLPDSPAYNQYSIGASTCGVNFSPPGTLSIIVRSAPKFGISDAGCTIASVSGLGFTSASHSSSSIDVGFYRDAERTVAVRGHVSGAYVFRVYNAYTSETNFERAKFAWESNRFVIGTEAQTGTKRGITLDATDLILSSLPTTDPVVAGRLWLDGTALKVSAGA
jgi:hypothetical protein